MVHLVIGGLPCNAQAPGGSSSAPQYYVNLGPSREPARPPASSARKLTVASYEIPDWLKAELPAEELEKLTALAGEHRTKALAPMAATLEGRIHEVLDDIKSSGKSERLAELTAAFNEFRSTAFPTAPAPRTARAASADGTPAAARERDGKREVAIWNATTSVVKQLGYPALKAAALAGVDTKQLRADIIRHIDAGHPEPHTAVNASDYVKVAAPAGA